MKKILSIDGGGIRGVIPAVILTEIERRTGRRIADSFDLVAGTSTGGILALGLACPGDNQSPKYDASELVGLYESEGANIFHRSLWHRIVAAENLLDEKYPTEGIEKVLTTYFGNAKLSQVVTEVLVTSYDIENRAPYFFKSRKVKAGTEKDFKLWQAARATSAAPTYFEPAKVTLGREKSYLALVDGGVYANNPAMCAYVEARALWPDEEKLLVVSLGTGELTRKIPLDEAEGWGLAKWARPILDVVFDGVSDTTDYQLNDLYEDDSSRVSEYHRFQVTLTEGNDDMDDATKTNIKVLKLLAENLIDKQDAKLDQLCQQLTA